MLEPAVDRFHGTIGDPGIEGGEGLVWRSRRRLRPNCANSRLDLPGTLWRQKGWKTMKGTRETT